MYEHDTIAAIATPAGSGGVAIVRISGDRAEALARAVFQPGHPREHLKDEASQALRKRKRGQFIFHSHHLYLGRVTDPLTGQPLDQALLALMRAPHSYTGEDVAEIQCHGGSFLVQGILEAVLKHGARLALPGEFTKRAFLNGRLDLSQAEAVLDLIQAKSAGGLRLALEQVSGRLSEQCGQLRERLLGLAAHLEAFLDFPEEDIPARSQGEFCRELSKLIEAVGRLHASFARGKVYRDGVRTVIVGKPNVGKSSLLNALIGTDRAIVTPVPGTTRDTLEETVTIGDIPLVVWDTAGLRASRDEVERMGIERTLAGIARAELVLAVFDASRPVDAEDKAVCDSISGKRIVPVLNKIDLSIETTAAELETRLKAGPSVAISARTGSGLDRLAEAITALLLGNPPPFPHPNAGERQDGLAEAGHGVIVTRLRHRDALIKTEQSLTTALESLSAGLPLDLVAVDLRAALDQIGEITGQVSSEDILDSIFGEFCIGK